jgi:hypothetical protein
MADKKISALTAATLPLDGTEVLPIVQSGTTVKVTNNSLRPTQLQSNATSGVLQVAGPAASTTRVMTVPNANFTAARTDAAQSFTGAQSFGNNINLTDSTAAKVNFATVSSATTNYIQTHSDGYSLMLYVDRGVSKPSYLMNFGGTHEWGFAGTSSLELDVTNKDLTIKTGNLVIGTSGKGIAYPVYGGGSAVQPVFSATANTTQAINAATWTKVDFANELFDSNSNFASSTFTPTVPGYYQLNASVYWASDPGSVIVSIYRSGNPFVEIGRVTTSAGGTVNGGALVYADGNTHTFEIYFRSVNANTLNDSTSTVLVTFNGALIRGA